MVAMNVNELISRYKEAQHAATVGEYETAKVYYDMCLAAIDQIRCIVLMNAIVFRSFKCVIRADTLLSSKATTVPPMPTL